MRRTTTVLLALIVLAAFALRTLPRWELTFGPDGLRMPDPDCWHHLRQIEQWVRHFPARMTWDPYMLHPHGQQVPVAPLFDALAAAIAWVLGAGSPSTATIHRVAALISPVAGALTCLPVFALGRRVGGTAGGFVAALVVAFLPGQLLARSILGYADHHALETLFAATTLAFMTASMADADAKRGLRLAAAAGIALALHLAAWTGGALLIVAVGACGIAVLAADAFRRRDTAPALHRFLVVCVVAGIAGPSLLAFGPMSALDATAAGAVAVALVATHAVVAACGRRGVRPGVAVAAALSLHVAVAVVAMLALPRVATTVGDALGWFSATAERMTVREARPLLAGGGRAAVARVWDNFGVAGIVAVAGWIALARRVLRTVAQEDLVVAVASLAAIVLAFAQVRFAAWGALATATLTAAALGPWLGRAWRGETRDTPPWLGRGVWPAAVAVGLVVPTATVTWAIVHLPGAPGSAWSDALRFLRDETPVPFGDSAAYERLPQPADSPVARNERGPSAYGVLAWWDAGYWITGIAHRVPLANGTQAGARDVARVLLETDLTRAAAEADRLGARYVVLDGGLPVLAHRTGHAGRIPSLAPWAGRDGDLTITLRTTGPDGAPADVALFLPDYFRSLTVRLHVFGGRAVPATDLRCVAWREAAGGGREVVAAKAFTSWDEAAAWARTAPYEHVAIGSLDPLGSCVPLEAATAFRLAFHSREVVTFRGADPVWDVQVWERVAE